MNTWMTPDEYPGLWTDVRCLGKDSHVTFTDDAAVVRTVSRLDFWGGNCLMLPRAPSSNEAAVALWRRSFADVPVRRILVQWEVPFGTVSGGGVGSDRIDVLTLRDPCVSPGREGHYAVVTDAAVFERIVQMTLQSQADGANGNRDDAYTRWQYSDYWRQMLSGRLKWYAGFNGDTLCCACGVKTVDGVARYVDVLTALGHRGQGWADGIVRFAAVKSLEEARLLVIAAEPDSSAGRVYRKIGFEAFSAQMSLSLNREAGEAG